LLKAISLKNPVAQKRTNRCHTPIIGKNPNVLCINVRIWSILQN